MVVVKVVGEMGEVVGEVGVLVVGEEVGEVGEWDLKEC